MYSTGRFIGGGTAGSSGNTYRVFSRSKNNLVRSEARQRRLRHAETTTYSAENIRKKRKRQNNALRNRAADPRRRLNNEKTTATHKREGSNAWEQKIVALRAHCQKRAAQRRQRRHSSWSTLRDPASNTGNHTLSHRAKRTFKQQIAQGKQATALCHRKQREHSNNKLHKESRQPHSFEESRENIQTDCSLLKGDSVISNRGKRLRQPHTQKLAHPKRIQRRHK